MKVTKSETLGDKDFYTTYDLIKLPWFPVRSTITITKLIENGKLHAVNVSTTKYKRYRIPRQSAKDFVDAQQNSTPSEAKRKAKKHAKDKLKK